MSRSIRTLDLEAPVSLPVERAIRKLGGNIFLVRRRRHISQGSLTERMCARAAHGNRRPAGFHSLRRPRASRLRRNTVAGKAAGHHEGRRRTSPLTELQCLFRASRGVERGHEAAEDLRDLQGKGTSLVGRLPKCAQVGEDRRLAIGKRPSKGDTRSVTRGEVLSPKLAVPAGIEAAPTQDAQQI